MNLVGHIVRKDARRLALPLALWLALTVAPALALRFFTPSFEGHVGAALDEATRLASIWLRLLGGIQLVFGYVLAAALVLEDPLTETGAFWATRPIARRRLLAAKVAGSALLFVALPVLVLLPVWLASGFGAREVALAAARFAQLQGTATLIALMFASISRNLAHVLFWTIALVAAEVATLALGASVARGAPLPVQMARHTLTHAWVVPVFGFVVVQQFLTLRRARAWATLAAVLVACLVIRMAWPWTLGSGIASGPAGEPAAPEDRAAQIVPDATLVKFSENALPTLFVTAPWSRERFYLPAFVRLPNGAIATGATGPGTVEAGLRLLGVSRRDEPLRWQLMAGAPDATRLDGALEVWVARPRIVGETPLRVNGEFSGGGAHTRIISLGRNEEGRLNEIFLEERDSASNAAAGWTDRAGRGEVASRRYLDRYFLVDRATGGAEAASSSDLGSVELHSLVRRFRRLWVPGNNEWRNATLVKVRYERERRFERPLEVSGVTVQSRHSIP